MTYLPPPQPHPGPVRITLLAGGIRYTDVLWNNGRVLGVDMDRLASFPGMTPASAFVLGRRLNARRGGSSTSIARLRARGVRISVPRKHDRWGVTDPTGRQAGFYFLPGAEPRTAPAAVVVCNYL